MEPSVKKNLPGAYLPSEEVAHFDHALDKLEKANQILQKVALGMKPAGVENPTAISEEKQ
jgi:hypothetical protein